MLSPLVNVDWLEQHLLDKDLVLLDTSMQQVVGMEPIHYDGIQCIPNSLKLDLEAELCDLTSLLPHTFPSQPRFNAVCERLGIDRDSKVVLYCNQGVYSSPRAWWIFKSYGFQQVAVLDGGGTPVDCQE